MQLRNHAVTFARDDDGAVAVMFGLAFVMLVLACGMAIDYARAESVRTGLQSDLDSALLAAAQRATSDEEVPSIAEGYFNENWKLKHGVEGISLSIARTSPTRITGSLEATVPTVIMAIAGFTTIPVSVSADVETATQNVEAALVLDTTGSMSGAKLEALKDASRSLIDIAYETAEAEQHVSIGLVPFSQYVNVGIDRRNEPWMSVPNDSSDIRNICQDETPVVGTSNCRMETATASNDGSPYSYESEVCDYQYGPSQNVCRDYTYSETWHGCAGSRNNPLDTLDEQYEVAVPGIMNVTCGSPLTPLTNQKDALKTEIDAFIATGETYVPSGLFWGLAALSKQAPFEEARSYGERVNGLPVRKILVLMTDGTNTKSPSYPSHDGTDSTTANDLTLELCDNIKAKGIEIFTVAFDIVDVPTKELIQSCASGPGQYFDATDPDELNDAFNAIARSFTPLRIAG